MGNTCTPLIGDSDSIKSVRSLLQDLAEIGYNVLITGETGVGKEVVARNLYEVSTRLSKPFVKINCAAMPDGLLESELFGYEPGAFTGAVKKKMGRLEMADGGVLFLDEIGDMSPALQPKLLHVLESGEFSPLGSHDDVKTDTWLITATNQDLKEQIREKRFRHDLFERLRGYEIFIPPLRRRVDDIPVLIEHFLKKCAAGYPDRKVIRPTSDQVRRLMRYRWPGNVRELKNMTNRILVTGNWEEIIAGLSTGGPDLGSALRQEESSAASVDPCCHIEAQDWDAEVVSLKKIRRQASERVERQVISHVLRRTHWNRSRACEILGISYKTLLYKISNLKIRPPSKNSEAVNGRRESSIESSQFDVFGRQRPLIRL